MRFTSKSTTSTALLSSLLTASTVLAQTPGSTQTLPIPADPSLSLAIIWGTKPIDSFNLYAGAAMQAQLEASPHPLGNSTDPVPASSLPTDWCFVTKTEGGGGPERGCAHLHIASQDVNTNALTAAQLLTVVSFIRGMGAKFVDFPTGPVYYNWNLEAIFNVVYDGGKAIANGYVANQTDLNIPVEKPDISAGRPVTVPRSFFA